jgi:plasmid maintenance system antidote protein VapI
MTSYFDRKSCEIDKAYSLGDDPEGIAVSQELERIELEMVRDVSLAAELPGCPASIRRSIHEAIRKYGVASQPGWSGVDTNLERRWLLERMTNSLHDSFHVLGSSAAHRTDSPMSPLRFAIGRGADYRARLDTPIDEDAFQQEGEPSSPWESIVEIIEARGISAEDFCARVGLDAATLCADSCDVTAIANAGRHVDIDEAFAAKLADVIGPNAEFWLARERNYRRDVVRLHEQRAKLADLADYLTNAADDPDLPRRVRRSLRRYANVLKPKATE